MLTITTTEICRHCRFRIPDDATICPGCGRRHEPRALAARLHGRSPLLHGARWTRRLLVLTGWLAVAFGTLALARYVAGLGRVAPSFPTTCRAVSPTSRGCWPSSRWPCWPSRSRAPSAGPATSTGTSEPSSCGPTSEPVVPPRLDGAGADGPASQARRRCRVARPQSVGGRAAGQRLVPPTREPGGAPVVGPVALGAGHGRVGGGRGRRSGRRCSGPRWGAGPGRRRGGRARWSRPSRDVRRGRHPHRGPGASGRAGHPRPRAVLARRADPARGRGRRRAGPVRGWGERPSGR